MEEKEIMCFKDEEGNKVELEVVAKLNVEEKEYLILSQTEEKSNTDDAFVFRIDSVNGSEEYNLVEEDKEFEAVKKEYKKLLYNK